MSDAQWYMAIGGHQIGPVAEAEIVANLQNGSASADTLVFTTGMTDWTPLKAVPKFAAYLKTPAASAPPPPPSAPGRRAHEIDFQI